MNKAQTGRDANEEPRSDGLWPFYERLLRRRPGDVLRGIFVAFALGLGFLGVHYASVGARVFEDSSWFLAFVIAIAAICIYYATDTLRSLCHDIVTRAGARTGRIYMDSVSGILSDRRLFFSGLLFGGVNCVFGSVFGLPYRDAIAQSTVLFGYFVAGFVCGLAVLGVYAILVAIKEVAQDDDYSFDFAAPDGCGGTAYVGDALLVFGSVTLLVGVFISIYILETEWLGGHEWWRVKLQYVWVAFPYLLSLIAFLAPAWPLHKALEEYKVREESAMKRQIGEVRAQIQDKTNDAARQKELRELMLFQQTLRLQLYKMRTWPFDLDTQMKYCAVAGANVAGSWATVSKWLRGHPFT